MMHIGKLAQQAGTTTRTVRYYEEMGLVQPEGRTPGGFRCYSDYQLIRLKMVLSLKEMGFDLERIKSILAKHGKSDTGGTLASAILGDLRARLKEVNVQITYYCRMRDRLMQSIESLYQCTPCEHRLEERICPECQTEKKGGELLPFFHLLPPPAGRKRIGRGVSEEKNKPSASMSPNL